MLKAPSTLYDQTIKLSPKQDRFIFSEAKYPAFVSGLGAGKTYAGCIKALLKAMQGEPGVIMAPTFPMLRDATQKTFLGILDRSNMRYEFLKTDGIVKFRGADILLRSADNPERLRGPNLNWAYLDEAAMMRESMWRVALGRLRAGTKPGAWITTTPAGFNWIHDYWVARNDPQYEMTQASTRENTFLPPAYVEDLEGNYSAEYALQEIEGRFVAFEGLIFSEFNTLTHVRDFKVLPEWDRVRAVDFGYTNPFVCLWGALDEDKRLCIYNEHYQRKTLIKDHASSILNYEQAHYRYTVADHDAQDAAELAACGVATQRAQKDVKAGIQKVKARFQVPADGKPRLIIHPRCTHLIKELQMYRWATTTAIGGNLKEEPLKEADHACDALRYMVMEVDHGGFVLV